MFDTHAIARSLPDAHVTPIGDDRVSLALDKPSDAITTAVRQAAKHEAAGLDAGTLATKTDLRTEIAGVDAHVAALELRLIKWIVGTGLTAAGIVLAGLRLPG